MLTRLQKKQVQYLEDEARLIMFISISSYSAIGGERQRYPWVQQKKFDDGHSLAKPGESQHEVCMATDLEFFDEDGNWLEVPGKTDIQAVAIHKGKLQKFGDYWESIDPKNKWGGNFKNLYDPGHFEREL